MALITWQDLAERAERRRGPSPFLENPKEFRKGFDYYIKHFAARYRNLPKDQQLQNFSDLINQNLKANNGKFVVGPGQGFRTIRPEYEWDGLVKKNPNAPKAFENYLKNKATTPALLAIAKKKIPLGKKYDLLDATQQAQARKSIEAAKATQGRLTLKQFAPFTNFSTHYLKQMVKRRDWNVPKSLNAENIRDAQTTINAKRFSKFFKDNNIEIFRRAPGDLTWGRGSDIKRRGIREGNIYFSNVANNPAQLRALDNFLNLRAEPSTLERKILIRDSHKHPLYKDTSQNLRSVLNASRDNLNNTIKGYNDKGLREFLKQHPRMLKNATMQFNADTGKINYTPLADIYKKGFNMSKLRDGLVFDIEHNRPIVDYWNKLSKDGKILAKSNVLNDAEFAHNLSIDTSRYNRGVKRTVGNWIRNNPTRTTEIAALETELGELGHRFYAGDKWRGRSLDFKPGYRDTVLDSWNKALEKSTGLKWSDQLKNISKTKWSAAMQDVSLDKNALRQLGTFLGCPGKFKSYDEGGRVSLATGGQGLSACVSTKLKQPGAMEKIAALPEEMGGALSKLKNTATTFLGMLGRGGLKAAPLAALAAAGAAAEPLVKQFISDDPNTYLTNENQMKGMLLATLEGEPPKVDDEILKWQMPALGAATVAGSVPGAGAVYKARRAIRPDKLIGPMEKGVGPARAALGIKGVLGKALGASFSPLAVAATLPMTIAAQKSGGTDYSDIATDPLNWMGPAFAASGAEMASKGIKNPMLLKALRMGMSPKTLSMVSRRFGMPGLAVSAGMWGYDKWKNRSVNDDE